MDESQVFISEVSIGFKIQLNGNKRTGRTPDIRLNEFCSHAN